MPLSEVRVGTFARGWTVARGNTPERFRAEILGVLPDAIAPGRDMIVVELSDVSGSSIISRAGGVWSGMSGSPVYIGGELIGAVAFSLTGGPSRIAGLTPAEDMLDVLSFSSTAMAAAEADAKVSRVAVPQSLRSTIAERADITEQQATSMTRLRLPLTASGLSNRGRNQLQKSLNRAGVPVAVMAGAAAPSPRATAFAQPQAGGNFAAVVSYGDVSLAGIGTTTYVCGNRALAFGHPFFFQGHSSLGANDANAIAIVADPLFGPFKLATIGAPFGRVNQDRLAAIRARLGVLPNLIPVTSRVTAVDTSRTRIGRSDSTPGQFLPEVAAFHLLGNVDATIDRVGQGSSRVRWVIQGQRANGTPWELVHANRYASLGDISFESIFELLGQLSTIQNNQFQAVTFDSVSIDARIKDTFEALAIEGVLISRNGNAFRKRSFLTVRPGDKLVVRVLLRRYRAGLEQRDLSLTVPATAEGGGYLQVSGAGAAGEPCFFDPAACPDSGASSFNKLLAGLRNAPRNDDLMATLTMFNFDGSTRTRRATVRLDAVVSGSAEIEVSTPLE